MSPDVLKSLHIIWNEAFQRIHYGTISHNWFPKWFKVGHWSALSLQCSSQSLEKESQKRDRRYCSLSLHFWINFWIICPWSSYFWRVPANFMNKHNTIPLQIFLTSSILDFEHVILVCKNRPIYISVESEGYL